MQGPLKTSIRNLTQQPLIFGSTNRIYLRPETETVYDFDPFTKFADNPAISGLLACVLQGKVNITYIYDSQFSSAVPATFAQVPGTVLAAMNLNKQPKSKTTPSESVEELKKRLRPEGTLPPGELPPDPVMEETKITKNMRPEQKLAIAIAAEAGIKKEAKVIDASDKVTEVLKEQNLHSEPDKASEKTAPVVVEDKPVKKGRKAKKEVVAL